MLISTGQMSWLVPIGQTGTAWSVLTGVLFSIGSQKNENKNYEVLGGSHARIIASHAKRKCACAITRIRTHDIQPHA